MVMRNSILMSCTTMAEAFFKALLKLPCVDNVISSLMKWRTSMKQSIFLSFFVICLCSSSAVGLPISLYDELDAKTQTDYIGGVASGILFMDAYYRNSGATPTYCMPSTVKLGSDLATVALSNYSGNRDHPVAFGVIEGLRVMFPCR